MGAGNGERFTVEGSNGGGGGSDEAVKEETEVDEGHNDEEGEGVKEAMSFDDPVKLPKATEWDGGGETEHAADSEECCADRNEVHEEGDGEADEEDEEEENEGVGEGDRGERS